MTTRTALLPILSILPLLLIAPVAQAEDWGTVKSEALKLFADTDAIAKERIAAMLRVGAADRKEAVDLLITLLKRRNPEEIKLHAAARDIESKIEGIYNRNRALLKKNMINANDQQEIAKLTIQLNRVNERINALDVIKRRTSDALGRCKSQAGYLIEKILDRDRDWQVRLEVVQALGIIGTEKAFAGVRKGIADEDYKVRTAALEVALKKNIKGLDDAFVEALNDDWWQVRAAATRAVKALKIYKAVGALIDALQLEDGRLTLEMDGALQELTGKTYYGDAELWARWWAANKEKFLAEVTAGKAPNKEAEQGGAPGAPADPADPAGGGHKGAAATTSFYGIKTASKRIIFILDISGSMTQKSTLPGGKPAPKVTGGAGHDDPASKFKPKDDTKMEIAKCELKRAIGNLPDDALFNIIFYNHEVEVWRPKMTEATDRNKEVAYHYIDSRDATSQTNIHDALQAAFDINMKERGRVGRVQTTGKKKVKVTRGGVDTIFFLTDGSPTSGKIVVPGAILQAVRLWNETRKIQIHTVGVGVDNNPMAQKFLAQLAQQNDGTYVQR